MIDAGVPLTSEFNDATSFHEHHPSSQAPQWKNVDETSCRSDDDGHQTKSIFERCLYIKGLDLPFFQPVEDEVLSILAQDIHERTSGKSEVIYAPGDLTKKMFFVMEGSIALIVPPESSSSDRVNRRLLCPRQSFGEISLSAGSARLYGETAQAEAEETEVMSLPSYELLELAIATSKAPSVVSDLGSDTQTLLQTLVSWLVLRMNQAQQQPRDGRKSSPGNHHETQYIMDPSFISTTNVFRQRRTASII